MKGCRSKEGRDGGPARNGGMKGCRAITCLSQELQGKGGFKTCGVSWGLAAEAKAIKEGHEEKSERDLVPVGGAGRSIHYNE